MSGIADYFRSLSKVVAGIAATDGQGYELPLQSGVDKAIDLTRGSVNGGGKLMFIGNGGSAGIASHLAIDFTKNGRLPALAFNDGAALTCLGNDLGFDQVFAHQVSAHGRDGDLLVAISSSGRSPDILKGVEAGRSRRASVVTLSGFQPDNPLRRLGDINFYVPNGEYGFVEITHLALCHAILDLATGWTAEGRNS